MRVSVISPDLSSNCLGRAHVLAELLAHNFEVEVAGPLLGDEIWEPISNERSYIELKITPVITTFTKKYRKALKQLTGDVVVAVKPQMTSFGLGLLKRYTDGTPLILDIDDWESGESTGWSGLFEHARATPATAYYLNNKNHIWLLERLAGRADAITVSNSFLQERFGGTQIPHVRDTDVFDPARFDQMAIREELGLPTEKTIVMFSGTPRPHKGVEYLISAINDIDNPEVVAVIVGAHDSEYVRGLKEQAGKNVHFYGRQPFSDLPKWIAAGDVFVIPQKQTQANRGQLPAKVFDAMAMAKPVIATNMSDMPTILDRCGIIIEPGDTEAIAEGILQLHNYPQKQTRLGKSARKRCVEKYSYNALAPEIERVVQRAVDNHYSQ